MTDEFNDLYASKLEDRQRDLDRKTREAVRMVMDGMPLAGWRSPRVRLAIYRGHLIVVDGNLAPS